VEHDVLKRLHGFGRNLQSQRLNIRRCMIRRAFSSPRSRNSLMTNGEWHTVSHRFPIDHAIIPGNINNLNTRSGICNFVTLPSSPVVNKWSELRRLVRVSINSLPSALKKWPGESVNHSLPSALKKWHERRSQDVAVIDITGLSAMLASLGNVWVIFSGAPRKISAYGMMIGVHGRGTARLFDPRPLIEAV
jgi:hypothetical protein